MNEGYVVKHWHRQFAHRVYSGNASIIAPIGAKFQAHVHFGDFDVGGPAKTGQLHVATAA